jgi:hypothetical protein
MKNKDSVEASLQNLIQCVQNHDPEISVYEGIPVDAFNQLSAQEDTKLHYQSQSQRPVTSTTLNPGTKLSEDDQTQAAQSEADPNGQLSRPWSGAIGLTCVYGSGLRNVYPMRIGMIRIEMTGDHGYAVIRRLMEDVWSLDVRD